MGRLRCLAMRSLFLSVLATSGCIKLSPYPDVGECAVYPDGQYEFGQIGIGTCIAGPNQLRFMGEGEDTRLLVTNANPYLTFDGGSLLSIPWTNIDTGDGTNEMHTLGAEAMSLPDFGIGLAVQGDLGFIGLRESEEARTRVYDDDVLLVDLSDPASPQPSTRGTDGGATVTVRGPVDVVIDSVTGLAFVANRTDHDISVLDTTETEIAVINPWPHTTVSAASTRQQRDGRSRQADGRDILATSCSSTTSGPDLAEECVSGSERGRIVARDQPMTRATDGASLQRQRHGSELSIEDMPEDVSQMVDPATAP